MTTESPASRLERLLQSLETLAGQEEMLVKDMLPEKIVEVQQRMTVVSESIATLAKELKTQGLLSPSLKKRAELIMTQQMRTLGCLQDQIHSVQGQLADLNNAKGRLTSMRPVYGRNPFQTKKTRGSSFNGRG